MSSQYGFLPNLIMQPSQLKPAETAPFVREPAKITKETAPAVVTKVAPSFETNALEPSRNQEIQTSEKRKTVQDQPLNLSAESKVAATSSEKSEKIMPSDLAEQKAQDLAQAKEHASMYREYKARTERALASENTVIGDDGTPQQRLDVRIPVIDEIPDRPLPRFGVPNV